MARYEISDPDGTRVPICSWLPPVEIEPAAVEQLRTASGQPDAALSLAVMPDCHVGFGVTIGSVLPITNAVLPNGVGVDIGCGMSAIAIGVRLDEERKSRDFWRAWSGSVRRGVPTGFDTQEVAQPLGTLDRPLRATGLQAVLAEKGPRQIGTLGGRHHFLEAQVDEDGQLRLIVHSGNRHTGLRIARHYHDLAVEIAGRRGLTAPDDLASLPLDDPSGQDYVDDLGWATDFARENRERMLAAMVETFVAQLERAKVHVPALDLADRINIHHNFARLETQEGAELMVHRKGATSAAEGEIGIIPGGMRLPSHIVRGRGNPDGSRSCSHEAGRTMSRKAGREAISTGTLVESLAGTYSKPPPGIIDEAHGVYKDVATVIARQLDLVEIVHTLRPLITVKGDSRDRDDWLVAVLPGLNTRAQGRPGVVWHDDMSSPMTSLRVSYGLRVDGAGIREGSGGGTPDAPLSDRHPASARRRARNP